MTLSILHWYSLFGQIIYFSRLSHNFVVSNSADNTRIFPLNCISKYLFECGFSTINDTCTAAESENVAQYLGFKGPSTDICQSNLSTQNTVATPKIATKHCFNQCGDCDDCSIILQDEGSLFDPQKTLLDGLYSLEDGFHGLKAGKYLCINNGLYIQLCSGHFALDLMNIDILSVINMAKYYIGPLPGQRVLLPKYGELSDSYHHLPPAINVAVTGVTKGRELVSRFMTHVSNLTNKIVNNDMPLNLRLDLDKSSVAQLVEIAANKILDLGHTLSVRQVLDNLLNDCPELIFEPRGGQHKGRTCYVCQGKVYPVNITLPPEVLTTGSYNLSINSSTFSENDQVFCEHFDCETTTEYILRQQNIILDRCSINIVAQ